MIDILLATYNGERFLGEQMDSLLSQTEQDFRVILQDDGSGDSTPALLAAYADAHPDRIRIISGLLHEKSSKGNFMSLLSQSEADYVMFCDQDDVWDKDKVSLTLARMREGEARYGAGCPLLVHTDLQVVDAQLRPIAPSFLRYQKLDSAPSMNRLLSQNSVTGCTMMVNKPLAALMRKASAEDMLMHDWWAALCAVSMGQLLFVDRPAIRYRQHGGNQLGASGFHAARDVQKAVRGGEDVRQRLMATFRQAGAFLACYEEALPRDKAEIIRRYAALPYRTKPARMWALVRHGHLKKGVLRSLGQLYYC